MKRQELEDQINVLCKEVYDYITGPRDTENVTEWCKREACWKRAKSQVWTINDPFIYTLVPKSEIKKEIKEETSTRKLENEVDSLKEIIARGSGYWSKVLSWGRTRKLLSAKEESILQMLVNMNITGRIPTERQAKAVIHARQRLIDNGMPLQF